MNKKQELYDKMGREIVNNFPRYRDDIIDRFTKEAETSGIILKDKKKKRVKVAPTIDMFPELPSGRKGDR